MWGWKDSGDFWKGIVCERKRPFEMFSNKTLTIYLYNVLIKIEKLTSEYYFLSTLLCPFTTLFIKWTQQHEKSLLLRNHLQKFCSINNTALFDNRVNKTNASDQNFIVWQAFQTICLPSYEQGATKYTYFSLRSPKSARHICYGNTISYETTKFGRCCIGSDVLGC